MKLKSTLFFTLLLFSFSLMAQEIELEPSKGWQGKLMTVGISGTNTKFSSATGTCGALEADKIVFHQGMTMFSPVSLNVQSDFQLWAQMDISSAAPLGLYDVHLWAGQGACEVSCQDCFEIFPQASITSVSPDQENINTSNVDVTITADFSCFNQGSSTCQANEGNVRFYQEAPNTFDFQPNSVTIVDDTTLIANIDLPAFVIVDDYNLVVAEGFPCEASCEGCFEVLADPFLELIMGNQGNRGEDVDVTLEVFFADISNCAYDGTTVFLQLDNFIIFPENVMVNGQMITFDVAIPSDAPLGDYDIVVGDELGGDCEYICEACFTVDKGVATIDPVYEDNLGVFPNPNNGSFILSSEVTLYDSCLEIYDATGRIVKYQKMDMFKEEAFDLDAPGVYLIKLATQESIQIKKVVVE